MKNKVKNKDNKFPTWIKIVAGISILLLGLIIFLTVALSSVVSEEPDDNSSSNSYSSQNDNQSTAVPQKTMQESEDNNSSNSYSSQNNSQSSTVPQKTTQEPSSTISKSSNKSLNQNNKYVEGINVDGKLLIIDIPESINKEGIYFDNGNIEVKTDDGFYYTNIIIKGNNGKYRINLPIDYDDSIRNYYVIVDGNYNEMEIKNAIYIDYLEFVGNYNYVSYDYEYALTMLLMYKQGLIQSTDNNSSVDCCWR